MTKYFLLAALLVCPVAYAQDAGPEQPSEESVRELIRVTDMRNMTDSMMDQTMQSTTAAVNEMLKDSGMTAQDRADMDTFVGQANEAARRDLGWDKLEPYYVKVFRMSFSQKEVDDLTAFYKTPSGQALLHKMPKVIQTSFAEMKDLMGPFIKDIGVLQKELMNKIKARHAKA